MDTTSARIGVNVTEREVSQLPINGRQLSQLYLQAPGTVNGGTGTYPGHSLQRALGGAERHPLRRRGGQRHRGRRARQHERRDNCPGAFPPTVQRRKHPGIPRGVEQLSGGVRHRNRRSGHAWSPSPARTPSTGRFTNTFAMTTLDAQELFRYCQPRNRSCAEPVRSLLRRAADQGQALLLRCTTKGTASAEASTTSSRRPAQRLLRCLLALGPGSHSQVVVRRAWLPT